MAVFPRNMLKGTLNFAILLIAVISGSLIYLYQPEPLVALRNLVFDQYQRLHPRTYQAAPVKIIDIDDESLARLGQWPWPRTLMSELVEKIIAYRGSVVGFDIVFAESDRTSPMAMADLWRVDKETRDSIGKLPDHDAVFAETLRKARVVVGFALKRESTPGVRLWEPFRIVTIGESPKPYLEAFEGMVKTLPAIERSAAGNGALTFIPDHDGVVRRAPLLLLHGDKLVPGFTIEMLRVALGARNIVVKMSPVNGTGLAELKIGQAIVPSTPDGQSWIYYTRHVPDRYIPAWRVLDGSVDPDALAGNILVVGTSAQGLMDLRFSPLGGVIPGVETHAQFLEQVLTGTFLRRPTWAVSIEAAIITLGGLVLGSVALLTGALISASITVIAVLGTLWFGWYMFVEQGVLLDTLTPSLTLVLTFMLASVVHHLSAERRERWVKEAFSRYVSPNLVEHLVKHPEQLELGGKRQECSFVFTDLADFTSLMEKTDPGNAVALLNTYLDEMITIAFRHEGTLDRIVGDAVAIVFSTPLEQKDHRRRALDCALEMYEFSSSYAASLNRRDIPFGKTRLGVHSGEVIVGNFGGSHIFDYRALGDAVNTAARLESANKFFGTHMMISEEILRFCPEASVRPIGRLVLKGKSIPLMTYEPLQEGFAGLTGTEGRDEAYEQAYRLLVTDSAKAAAAFNLLAKERPWDPLSQYHATRLRMGGTGDLIVMDEK